MSSDEEMRALASQIAVERMRSALPPIEPERDRLRQAEGCLEMAASRADAAESRVRELEAEVERLKAMLAVTSPCAECSAPVSATIQDLCPECFRALGIAEAERGLALIAEVERLKGRADELDTECFDRAETAMEWEAKFYRARRMAGEQWQRALEAERMVWFWRETDRNHTAGDNEIIAELRAEIARLTRALADDRESGARRVEAMRERCAAVAERIGAEAGHGIPAHVRGLVCTRIANEIRALTVAPEGERE